MGTQGERGKSDWPIAKRGARIRFAVVAAPLLFLPAVSACSSSSPSVDSDKSTGFPYPSKSLSEYFRDPPASAPPNAPASQTASAPATQTAATVPHPPSTYTPVSEPAAAIPTAPQAPTSTAAAPAPSTPADNDAVASAYPYPTQSLSDWLSRK
jgi:hypothetical protein